MLLVLLIDNKKLDEVNAMTYNFSAQQAVIFRLAAVNLLCFEGGSSL